MKKFSQILIIAMIAVIGLGVSGCEAFLGGEDDNDSSTKEYGWYGNGSASNFNISNFAQLKEFDRIVQGYNLGSDGPKQSDFTGKTVTLTADIDMSGKDWYGGIGGFLPSYPFNGTFDGGNKTISGLNVSRNGFFAIIEEDGIVKNLTFVDLTISNYSAGVTMTNRGKIQNITITNGYADDSASGVVCYNFGIVENCNFSGDISDSYSSGGIASHNDGIIRNCYVTGSITTGGNTGGIVDDNRGTVENCYTTCDIVGLIWADNVGGIVGNNRGIVKNCYATGNISNGDMSIGGVVGSNEGRIQNCYATGIVTGDNNVGGITGGGGTVQYCVALNPSITATSGSYQTNISISRVGYVNSGSLSNSYGLKGMTLRYSYYSEDVPVTSNANDIHGEDVEAPEYNTQSWWTSTVNWDFNTVWQWDSSGNLPKLRF